jgi:hypothetical protein
MNTSSHEIPQLALESWETLPQLPARAFQPDLASVRRRFHDLACNLREQYEAAVQDAKDYKLASAAEKALFALRDAIIAIEAWHKLNDEF